MAGYTFSRFGSVTAFRLIGFVALTMCVVQMAVNHLVKRITKKNARVQVES